MKKHNVDTSLMTISAADQKWANDLVFNGKSLEFKNTLDPIIFNIFLRKKKN
jgi:hypothetical protein